MLIIMMNMEKNQQTKLIQQNQDQISHMVDMLIIMKNTVKKKYQRSIRKSIISLKNNQKLKTMKIEKNNLPTLLRNKLHRNHQSTNLILKSHRKKLILTLKRRKWLEKLKSFQNLFLKKKIQINLLKRSNLQMVVLSTQVICQILKNQYQLSNQIKDKLKLELKHTNTN